MIFFRDVLAGWLLGRALAPVLIVGLIGAALYSPTAELVGIVVVAAVGLLAALYLAIAAVIRVLDL